ncbi:hypothetical protein AB7M50_008862 [Bradyrhizobium elkanii]
MSEPPGGPNASPNTTVPPLVLVNLALPAELVSRKVVSAPLVLLTVALPAVLLSRNSVMPKFWLTIVAVDAVVEL